jgi:hypothetical protein
MNKQKKTEEDASSEEDSSIAPDSVKPSGFNVQEEDQETENNEISQHNSAPAIVATQIEEDQETDNNDSVPEILGAQVEDNGESKILTYNLIIHLPIDIFLFTKLITHKQCANET